MEKDIIIFVHGTFAKEASWMKEDSKIYKVLSENFNIKPFNWSGKNSHIARHHASKRLYIFIENLINKNKSRKINIISHSHGGNVVLKSLKYSDKNIENINTIICLGTPFISMATKEFPISMTILSFIFSIISYYAIIIFLVYIISLFLNMEKHSIAVGFLLLAVVVSSMYFQNKIFNFLEKKIVNFWDKTSLFLKNFYTQPLIKKINVFCAYTNQDEAYNLLNRMELITSYFQNQYYVNKEKIQIIIFLISTSFISITLMENMNFKSEDWILDLMVKIFAIFLTSSIITFIIYHFIAYLLRLINYLLTLFFTNHPLSFGFDNILGVIFVRVLIKKLPLNNNYNIYSKEYKFKTDECNELLFHSCFYNDDKVINDILAYLNANKTE